MFPSAKCRDDAQCMCKQRQKVTLINAKYLEYKYYMNIIRMEWLYHCMSVL